MAQRFGMVACNADRRSGFDSHCMHVVFLAENLTFLASRNTLDTILSEGRCHRKFCC